MRFFDLYNYKASCSGMDFNIDSSISKIITSRIIHEVKHMTINKPLLVSIMAWRLVGTKPLSELILIYRQLVPKEQYSVKFSSKVQYFHSRKCNWKCHLQNGGHLSRPQCVNYDMNSRSCSRRKRVISWWRHQIETFSGLLAICAGNSPVTGEFPTQRPMTRSFDAFFDVCLNKWLD